MIGGNECERQDGSLVMLAFNSWKEVASSVLLNGLKEAEVISISFSVNQ